MKRPPRDAPLDEQAEYWVVRLGSGEIDAAELAAFKAWRAASPEHRVAFDRERALWRSLDGAEAAFMDAPFAAPAPVRRRTRVVTPRRLVAASVAAAAAAAALVVLAPDVAVRLQADAIARTGEVRAVALPDGSTAMLDTDAAIAIRFSPAERRIALLRGQAWFDVKHGDRRPFEVAALGGVTRDLGTAFEVSRSTGAVTVSVTQGAVRVAAPETGLAVDLTALGRARYTEGGPVERIMPGSPSSIATWRRRLIVIDGEPAQEAIAEVARYRPGLTLTMADTSAQPKVSGVFRTDAPDEALETLAHMAGLRVATLPGGVAILRR